MPRRTATGPNGEKLELIDGKWVPMDTPSGFVGPVDEITGPLPSLGRNAGEQTSNLRQGMRQGFGSFLANMASIPHAAGELLAAGAAVPALIPGGKSFSEARAEQEKQFPARALLAIPDVTTEQVLAVPSTAKKTLGDVADWYSDPNRRERGPVSIAKNFRAAVAEEEQLAADNPLATGAGRTAGDVASMLTLRPGQRASKALNLTRFNPRAQITDTKSVLDAAARTLMRGTGRTAEAGFDGAVMGALGDGDPVKTAAWSAGVQAGGSLALTAKNAFLRNPLKTFATLYLGHEMWKAITPGPQDLFASKDAAVGEMVTAYALGTVAALAGSSRGVGAGKVQRISDAMSSASRAGIASVVTQLQEAQAKNQPQYARVLELLAQDQERFGTDARVLLERAARSDKPRALLNQIDELMKSARFRKALEDADAPEEEEPQKQGFGEYLMRR